MKEKTKMTARLYCIWHSFLIEVTCICRNLCLQLLISLIATLYLWINYYSQRFNDSPKLTLTNFKKCIRLPLTGFPWLCWYREWRRKLNILPRKIFRDCGLPYIKCTEPASLTQDSSIPYSSAQLTGNMMRHLNSAGIAIPSNQSDFWWTKSPRKVDAFALRKKKFQARQTCPNQYALGMTACKRVICFVLNSGSVKDSTRSTRTNQIHVFDSCFDVWKHRNIFLYATLWFQIVNFDFFLWNAVVRWGCK